MAAENDYDPDNIFAKILDGKIPSFKVYEDDHVLAILDAFPVTPGHTLVLTKKRGYKSIEDMSEEDASNFMASLPMLSKAVKKATAADAVNVVSNLGAAAGQMVFHPHIHLIPRKDEDGLFTFPASAKEMIGRDVGDAMVGKLKAAL